MQIRNPIGAESFSCWKKRGLKWHKIKRGLITKCWTLCFLSRFFFLKTFWLPLTFFFSSFKKTIFSHSFTYANEKRRGDINWPFFFLNLGEGGLSGHWFFFFFYRWLKAFPKFVCIIFVVVDDLNFHPPPSVHVVCSGAQTRPASSSLSLFVTLSIRGISSSPPSSSSSLPRFVGCVFIITGFISIRNLE